MISDASLKRISNTRQPKRSPRCGLVAAVRRVCICVLIAGGAAPLAARATAETPDPTAVALAAAAGDERLQRFRVVIGDVLVEPELPLSDSSLASVSRLIFDAAPDLTERVYLPGELVARVRALAAEHHAQNVSQHAGQTDAGARSALEASDDASVAAPQAPPPIVVSATTIVDLAALGLSDRVALEIELPDTQLRPLAAPSALAASAARATEADLYLYTIARSSADLIFLEIRAYNAILDLDRRVFAGATSAEGLSALLIQARSAIVTALAGGPRAALQVTVPDGTGGVRTDISVFVDDQLLGVGSGRLDYLPPGAYQVRAELIDGRAVHQTVVLVDDEERVLEIEAPPRAPNAVVIDSVPRGAIVYRNALRLGQTPLRVPAVASEQIYTLQLENHYDARLVLGPEAAGRITRAMVPLTEDWAEQVLQQRNAFYRSFGLFAVSIAGPLIFQSEYDNRAVVDPDAAQPLLYGYYGSVGLSATLFVHMLTRLTRYIDTAQGYHLR